MCETHTHTAERRQQQDGLLKCQVTCRSGRDASLQQLLSQQLAEHSINQALACFWPETVLYILVCNKIDLSGHHMCFGSKASEKLKLVKPLERKGD